MKYQTGSMQVDIVHFAALEIRQDDIDKKLPKSLDFPLQTARRHGIM